MKIHFLEAGRERGREEGGERERDAFGLLVHFPHNGQAASDKAWIRSFLQASRTAALGPSRIWDFQ